MRSLAMIRCHGPTPCTALKVKSPGHHQPNNSSCSEHDIALIHCCVVVLVAEIVATSGRPLATLAVSCGRSGPTLATTHALLNFCSTLTSPFADAPVLVPQFGLLACQLRVVMRVSNASCRI